MPTILRLEGLDAKASTKDLRTFFDGITIPEGGVYILGGKLKEAFIGFSTQKDGQLAMRRSGNPLKGSKVTLHISSMEELERKLKSFLQGRKPIVTQRAVKNSRMTSKRPPSPTLPSPLSAPASPCRSSTASSPVKTATLDPGNTQKHDPLCQMPLDPLSLDSKAAFLLGMCTVLQGLQSSTKKSNNVALHGVDGGLAASPVTSTEVSAPEEKKLKPGYVRLFGLPATTTKDDICQFFKGLPVLEAIVNVKMGQGHCCLTKFADSNDAFEALRFNKQHLGSVCVDVRRGTEEMWDSGLAECTNSAEAKQSPLPSYSPTMESSGCDLATPSNQNVVMVKHLPKRMTKTEIKELFACPNITHYNVLHLLDKEGDRTDTAFLVLDRQADFDYAVNLSGCHVGSNTIEVLPITKATMKMMISKTKRNSHRKPPYAKGRPLKPRREVEHGH